MNFDPALIKSFSFLDCSFEPQSGSVNLHYALEPGYLFCEQYRFPGAPFALSPERKTALQAALKLLHLAAGVSYYKAAVPNQIVIQHPINQGDAAFFEHLYFYGLGEFAYKNKLDIKERIKFPYADLPPNEPSSFALGRESAVLLGGGKDSIVTVQALSFAQEPMRLLSLGGNQIISDVAAVSSYRYINIIRRLDPALITLNHSGAYNGHVPISAIIAAAAAVAAILYDFDAIVVSNERSANQGNLCYLGEEINHQFSKSYEFERLFNSLLQRRVHAGLRYFSFLRPLSELGIAKAFSKSSAYDLAFTSCNSAFKLHSNSKQQRWCRRCPKCHFVYLMLAPFMNPSRMIRIFGEELLDREDLAENFDALCGFGTHKPFECVGEPEEAQAAFILLGRKKEWQERALVKRFKAEYQDCIAEPDKLLSNVLKLSEEHALDLDYMRALDSYLALLNSR
ncbi:MAG: endonuclease domain-containing protein [Deltaproteobacteria bacterium]|nr:endonuclease domain-containing protein [Deltaproteobacteria bacterium]